MIDCLDAQFLRSLNNKGATIGIMGGTFDPPHLGHLACADQAQDACNLAAVVFTPAATPSFKRDKHITQVHHRVRMCQLAIESNPDFYLSFTEVERSGITYTADTLREFRHNLPEDIKLAFIIGTDSLMTLGHWREAESLTEMASFVCVSRPGAAEEAQLIKECNSLLKMGFDIKLIEAPLLDISSSQIRQRVSQGKTIRYLVPDGVREYIYENNLYKE